MTSELGVALAAMRLTQTDHLLRWLLVQQPPLPSDELRQALEFVQAACAIVKPLAAALAGEDL